MGAERALASLAAVRRRDELLSLLYWLRADRLSETVGEAELAAFAGPGGALESDLEALVGAGLAAVVEAAEGRRYRLTAAGMEEGKRRFEEDFAALPADGTAGNAHEVILGVCGPNARCVREGTHEACDEPALVRVDAGEG